MTPQKYLAILDENLALADGDWFDDPDFEFSDQFTYSGAAAVELLGQGVPLWDCPGWVADMAREFEMFRFGDNRVRGGWG